MKTKQRICIGTRWLASHSAIIATTLLFLGCDSAVDYFTYVPSGQSTRTPDAQWNDRSFHEIIESAASTDEKTQRIQRLVAKGGNVNELRRGTTPAMKAVGWGGQYQLAILLLESGADPTVYASDSNQRLVHFVLSEKPRAMSGNHIEKSSYARLVKWLEDHGESMAEAQKDFERWRSWRGNPESFNRRRRAEIAAREEQQQEASEQQAEQHEHNVHSE